MSLETKYIDLSFTKEMYGEETVGMLLPLYIEQVAEFLDGLSSGLEKKDWGLLGRIAHKTKGSVSILGMKMLEGDLRKLQFFGEYFTKFELQKKVSLDDEEKRELENLSNKTLRVSDLFIEEESDEINLELKRFEEGGQLSVVPELVRNAIFLIEESAKEASLVLESL
jgi:HPt (histidine-containing phosphotransfer) domain-containing protein